jgi:hypothetical protein
MRTPKRLHSGCTTFAHGHLLRLALLFLSTRHVATHEVDLASKLSTPKEFRRYFRSWDAAKSRAVIIFWLQEHNWQDCLEGPSAGHFNACRFPLLQTVFGLSRGHL